MSRQSNGTAKADLDVRPRQNLSLVPLEDQISRQVAGLKIELSVLKVQTERLDSYAHNAGKLLRECMDIMSPQALDLFQGVS